jgi:hypothetical protein
MRVAPAVVVPPAGGMASKSKRTSSWVATGVPTARRNTPKGPAGGGNAC